MNHPLVSGIIGCLLGLFIAVLFLPGRTDSVVEMMRGSEDTCIITIGINPPRYFNGANHRGQRVMAATRATREEYFKLGQDIQKLLRIP